MTYKWSIHCCMAHYHMQNCLLLTLISWGNLNAKRQQFKHANWLPGKKKVNYVFVVFNLSYAKETLVKQERGGLDEEEYKSILQELFKEPLFHDPGTQATVGLQKPESWFICTAGKIKQRQQNKTIKRYNSAYLVWIISCPHSSILKWARSHKKVELTLCNYLQVVLCLMGRNEHAKLKASWVVACLINSDTVDKTWTYLSMSSIHVIYPNTCTVVHKKTVSDLESNLENPWKMKYCNLKWSCWNTGNQSFNTGW